MPPLRRPVLSSPFRSSRFSLVWASSLLLAGVSAHAADITWVPAAGGAWSDTDNWDADPAAFPGATDDVFIGGATAKPINLGGDQAAHSLTFNNSAATTTFSGGSLTIGAGGVTIATGSSGQNLGTVYLSASQTWTIGSNRLDGTTVRNAAGTNATLTLTTAGSNTEIFTSAFHDHSGGGSLALIIDTANQIAFKNQNPNNSYSGGTTIKSGTLRVEGLSNGTTANALGTGTITLGDTSGSANATLTLLNPITVNNNIVAQAGSTGTRTISSLNASSHLTFTGSIALGTALTFNTNSATITASGLVSGAGNLRKISAGTLLLTNNLNDFTGDVEINGGIISTATIGDALNKGALGQGSKVSFTGNGATLLYTGAGETTSRNLEIAQANATIEQGGTGTLTFTGTNTVSGNRSLILKGSGDGEIANGFTHTGTLNVTKQGAGTWTLGGVNSFNGGITVSEGRFLINDSVTLTNAANTVSVAAGASFGGHGGVNRVVNVASGGGIVSDGPLGLAGGLTGENVTFNLTLGDGFTHSIDFGGGALNLTGTVTLNFLSISESLEAGVYTLFIGSGDWTGSESVSFALAGLTDRLDSAYGIDGIAFDAVGRSLTISLTAVPEPASVAALAGLGVLTLATLRRRSRSRGVA